MKQTALKDAILLKALADAPFDGWCMDTLRAATEAEGHPRQMADALFAEGIRSANEHVGSYFDRRMMQQLQNIDTAPLRVRDRIEKAVMTRLDLMAPHRAGLRAALARPSARCLWRSADTIWVWAGDTATDYNHYTKRGLLAGVMASTLLFWLQDTSPQYAATRAFLARRIENVLAIGKLIGRRKAA